MSSQREAILHKGELLPYFAKAISDKEIEIELIYGAHPGDKDKLQKPDFLRLLKHLRTTHPLVSETSTLDISKQYVKVGKTGISNIRCSLSGIQAIRTYCKTNSILGIDDVVFMRKMPYRDPHNPSMPYGPKVNRDYNYRVNMKQETILEEEHRDVLKFKENLKDSLKTYRYKKRFSFTDTSGLFRIDLTALKQCPRDYKTNRTRLYKSFLESQILQMPEDFEVEIEYIGSHETEGGYPVDKLIQRIKGSKSVLDASLLDTTGKPQYFNVFSELGTIESVVPVQGGTPDLGEFSDDYQALQAYVQRLFPINFKPITSHPETDIWYSYWDKSGQEWLLDVILDTERQLNFREVLQNTVASYKGALKTDYAIYDIYPKLTEDDVPYGTLPADIPTQIMVPVIEIQETSESQKLKEPLSVEIGESLARYSDLLMNPPDKVGPVPQDQGKDQDQDDPQLTKKQEKLRVAKKIVETVVDTLAQNTLELLQVIRETEALVPRSLRDKVLSQYRLLTEQKRKRTIFVGPNPVPISLEEMNPENAHTILHGYMVTEKADGIRAELFIDKAGHGYLITPKLKVLDTGIDFKGISGQWLFDGEYITLDKQGEPTELYMIFDVYYAADGGSDKTYPAHAYTYPWISPSKKDLSRSTIISEFQRDYDMETESSELRVGFKRYYEGPKALKESKKDKSYSNLGAMGKVSRKILDRDQTADGFGYTVDGLIYLPMFCPVGSHSETAVESIGGPWLINYKWKEASENTIDFKLKIARDQGSGKPIVTSVEGPEGEGPELCTQIHLYVYYDMKRDPNYDYTWLVASGDTSKPLTEVPFNPPDSDGEAHICNLPTHDGKLLCSRDKVEITDGMIVEMRYCPERPKDSRWEPLRYRYDKEVPQLFTHSYQIWSTIQNPVTEPMIRGSLRDLKKVPKLIEDISVDEEVVTDSYYVDTDMSKRDGPLRDFHNYIKSKLISAITSIGNKKLTVMDTSVGRGGDINKFLRSKNEIFFFLGLDISPDVNIAAKRYYQERMRKPRAMFIQYDTSQSLREVKGCQGPKERRAKNTHLIDILYNRDKSLPKEYRPLVPKFKSLGSRGFNVISSQFTLHYYFKDESTLRGYIQNLSDNCKKNGYFIGTCYDGMKVFQMLNDKPEHTLDMEDEFGNKVFSLRKKYEIEDFAYSEDNKSDMFGQEIDVYMNSIGQTITEYLVNFQMFIDIMKEYNFVLVNPKLEGKYSGIFDNVKFSYARGLGGFDQLLKNLQNLSSKDPELNPRTGHFKDALNMLKKENHPLAELSSLNNWFIFQKKP